MKLPGERVVVLAPMQAALEPIEVSTDDLGPTEVVIRTRVTLISPGTERANWHGKQDEHLGMILTWRA